MTTWLPVAGYAVIVAVAFLVAWLAGRARVPAALAVLLVGLAAGPTGWELVDPVELRRLLPMLSLHLAVVLAALGWQLGRGLLRLSIPEIVRRSLLPVGLAAFALLVGTALLPKLLPDLHPERTFRRFLLPLAFVLAAFPLLAIRDLRGRPPADVGHVFLTAIALVGAVVSFAPPLLWTPSIDLGVVWRGPVLVLGESGALGVFTAVLYLFITRRLRAPRRLVGVVLFAALVAACWGLHLWVPFSGLGFGIALGRAGEARLPLPASGRPEMFSEFPFALLAGLGFAPVLWWDSLVTVSLLHAAYVLALVLMVRRRVPGGRRLVTGPGLLFLGLALAIRLDPRMGPLSRVTLDFVLPAWLAVRMAVWWVGRRESRVAAA